MYVCTGQNQFEVVCSSSASDFLEWNLTFPALNNFPYIRIISKTNVVGFATPIKVESVEFMVTVTQNPLTSRASANQISPVLNGSMILCREQYQNAEISGNSAEVVIHVVNSTTAGLFNGVQPYIIVSRYFSIQSPRSYIKAKSFPFGVFKLLVYKPIASSSAIIRAITFTAYM